MGRDPRLLAAERAAFALRQTAAGNVVSEVGRDPSCDGVDRRRGGAQVQRHVRLVDGVRHVEEVVEELGWAVEEDPALLQQRLLPLKETPYMGGRLIFFFKRFQFQM